MKANRPRLLALISASALWTYLVLTILPGLQIGDAQIRTRHALIILLVGVAILAWISSRLARQERTRARLNDFTAAAASLLLSLLVADTLFAIWQNVRTPVEASDLTYERANDAVVWHGELYPRTYHPTDRAFVLYKPGYSVRAMTYGEYYERRMRESPALADSVLEYRPVGYRINRHGLREDAAFAGTRVYALGDSYVFGYATDEGRIWTDVLERAIGEPVYNLGVSSTGPRQQVQLLEHLLANHSDSMRVAHLLWMIFEGNDLINDYARTRERPAARGASRWMAGTLPAALASAPRLLREQSVLHKILTGSVQLRGETGAQRSHMEVDQVRLRNPLYRSPRWGYRLFNPVDIAQARKPRAYVESHANAPALAATVRDMQALSEAFRFRVTVVLAPSDVRLYGAAFDDLPALSDAPHFLEHVAGLARAAGFDVVDLATLMQPFAERELLYYRDDHHWNARGNEVAAQLLAETVWPGTVAAGTGRAAGAAPTYGPVASSRSFERTNDTTRSVTRTAASSRAWMVSK